MAITNSTLSAAVTADTSRFPVASSTGAAAGQFVKIDDEYAVIKEVISSTLVEVKHRGSRGTLAEAHTSGAVISFFASAEDVDAVGPRLRDAVHPFAFDVATYTAAGAIAVPTRNTIAKISGGSALAMTLAGPGKDSDGVMLLILTTTAYAHTVTYTAGFKRNTTSSDVATFAATANGSLLLVACEGTWVCVNVDAFAATAQCVIA